MIKIISVNERGSLTLPKEVREQLGIIRGGQVILDTNKQGGISLSAGAVFPVEIYTEERIREFNEMNNTPLTHRKLRFLKQKVQTKTK